MQGILINPNPGSAVSLRANAKGLILPVMDGLEGVFIYEDSVARSLKNWVPGKADAATVGTVAMGTGNKGLVLKNNTNYLTTSVAETDNMTLISVQENSAKRGFAISNYPSTRSGVSGTSKGVGIQLTAPSGSQGITAFDSQFNGTADATSNLLVPAGFTLAASGNRAVSLRTVEPAGSVYVDDLTGGVKQTATRTTQVRDKGTAAMRLGSSYSADAGDDFLYYMHILYSRALSDADLAKVYAWIKAYWARRSVTV